MFDFVVQIRGGFIHSAFNELRRTGRPFLQETLDEVTPLSIGDMTVEPIINLPDNDIPVSLETDDQMVELSLTSIALQLKLSNVQAIGDLLVEGAISMLLRLPIVGETANGKVRAGFDKADVGPDNVFVNLDAGHPFNDDQLVLEVMNRVVQKFFDGDDDDIEDIEQFHEYNNLPLPLPGLAVDSLIRIVNDVGSVNGRYVRVEPSAQFGRVRLTMPLEIHANVVEIGSDDEMPLHEVHFLADLHADALLRRNLNPPGEEPASIELDLPSAITTLEIVDVIDGDDVLNLPGVGPALHTFVEDQGASFIAAQGVQRIEVFTLNQAQELLRQMIIDALTDNARFIQFWEAPQSEATADIAVRIIDDDTLAIGINAGVGATLLGETPMIPTGRDFAIRLSDEALVEELNANFTAPAEYDHVNGDLAPLGPTLAGASTIVVAGFDDAGNTVRQNTRFRLDGFIYTVMADAEILEGDSIGEGDDEVIPVIAELSVTPALNTNVGPDDDIDILFGVGLPLTESAGDNGQTFRINDDLTATFQEGAIRLTGSGRLRRPNAAVFRTVNVDLSMSLGMNWASTGIVNGGGQTGAELVVQLLDQQLREIPDNSLIIIDGEDEPRRLASAANVSGDDATLQLSSSIELAPDDDTMISLRWLRIGRVSGDEQIGNTLQVTDMSEGEGLIPAGSVVRIDGENFAIENDTIVSNSGSVTVTLGRSLSDSFDNGPADEEPVRLFGGWSGRGAVDGANQTGITLALSGVVRTVANNTTLTVAGMPGLFKVNGTTDIINNTATLTLEHAAIDQLSGLIDLDEDELWSRIGQPGENASVRRRSGGQSPTLHLIGNPDVEPDVNLGSFLGGIVGAIIGVILTFVTGGGLLIGLIGGIVAGFIVKAIAERIISNVANDQAEDALSFVDVPFPDELSELGVVVDSIFNNPIEISPDGLVIAGRAVPVTVFPDLAESRADANGPYEFRAGIASALQGGTLAPQSAYQWQSGNGALLEGLGPSHTYPRRGTYVADLLSVDDQLGLSVETRELAEVVVRNTRPTIGIAPIIEGVEGEEVELELPFIDVAWLDRHQAIVDWGDHTIPTIAEVNETVGPPQTTGAVTARHTYCDNGVYVVTIILTDAPGGEARVVTEARIANVAPVVDAGPDVFAHPCVPTRFVGDFTDQGWCDTHTGVWDFGDCSPPVAAFIEETNTAPEAVGIATASHCYTRCGTFVATLMITDDDGASTSDTVTVRYSDIVNGDFEQGFELQTNGKVARHWQGYARPSSSTVSTQEVFDCESCLVCDGQRSQAVRGLGFDYAGISQHVGSNVGWEYQITATVQVVGADASAWLGIDPTGGTDRDAETIVWRHVNGANLWQALSTRAVAEAGQITVFLEQRSAGNVPGFFDCVAMQAYPCMPGKKPEKCEEPFDPDDTPPEKKCVNWKRHQIGELAPMETFGGWDFATASGDPLRIATFGEIVGEGKLRIPDRPDALLVDFGIAQQVVHANVGGGGQVTMTAFDAGGGVLGTDQLIIGEPMELTVTADGIVRVVLESDLRGTLIELCAVCADSNQRTGSLILMASPS